MNRFANDFKFGNYVFIFFKSSADLFILKDIFFSRWTNNSPSLSLSLSLSIYIHMCVCVCVC